MGGSPEEQKQEYHRHLFGNVITFYTWFGGVNYFVMGWMAANFGDVHLAIVSAVSALFIFHCVLTAFGLLQAANYLDGEVESVHGSTVKFYAKILRMLVVGAFVFSLAWIVFPFAKYAIPMKPSETPPIPVFITNQR